MGMAAHQHPVVRRETVLAETLIRGWVGGMTVQPTRQIAAATVAAPEAEDLQGWVWMRLVMGAVVVGLLLTVVINPAPVKMVL